MARAAAAETVTGVAPTRGATTSQARLSKVVDPPLPNINKVGFIDHSDGANIRTGPAESGGQEVREQPLPPATQLFVSGRHPHALHWWYVTAHVDQGFLRGYVQDFRVTTNLPEPTAKLYQIRSGDTAERLAMQEFSTAIRDGHDLRFYENVLLFVNKDRGRTGITGTYQDPGLFGGGANNIQLIAGHRIWLVSPAYARALEAVVPSGSLTGGAVAMLKRFAGHLEDIIASVAESPDHLGEVAGEYAQAILDHIMEIVGIVTAFIMAEALSAFLAATPTGVGQIAALVIQLALAAFGVAGMVSAGLEAVKHASEWLTLAWTASGDRAKIAAASREFLKMLVSIAMAALAYLGFKGNVANAATIFRSLPPPPTALAFAVEGGGVLESGWTATPVAIGPPSPAGPIGPVAMMTKVEKETSGAKEASETEELRLPAELDARLAKVIKQVVSLARKSAFRKAGNYHPHFDDTIVVEILRDADAIYESEGKAGRLIFRKGTDIVVVEGPGSGQGNIITGYGPSGIKGPSGAQALGGVPSDVGAPVTHQMIIDGTVPVAPGRPPIPKARQVVP